MSGGGDKTEQPTEKRLRDAFKKGDVASTREPGNFTALLAVLVLITAIMPTSLAGIVRSLTPFVETPHDIAVSTFGDVYAVAWWTVAACGAAFTAFAAAVFALGAVGAVMQGRFTVSGERIRPKLNKISPLSGIKRLVSKGNLVEFLKGVLKVFAVCAITAVVLIPHFTSADRLVGLTPQAIIPAAAKLGAQLLGVLLIVVGAIAAFDRFWKQKEWKSKLMMTKQEVKEEYKQNDGDPTMKARRRDKARMMVKHRMMSRVPAATFVVTNPTHYAVALRYVPGDTDAPVCLAKGLDNVAFKIREIAEAHNIPIIENPPLARALHATAELEQIVPEEHFEAVAQVVTFVMSLRGRAGTVRFPGAGD